MIYLRTFEDVQNCKHNSFTKVRKKYIYSDMEVPKKLTKRHTVPHFSPGVFRLLKFTRHNGVK